MWCRFERYANGVDAKLVQNLPSFRDQVRSSASVRFVYVLPWAWRLLSQLGRRVYCSERRHLHAELSRVNNHLITQTLEYIIYFEMLQMINVLQQKKYRRNDYI